MEAPLTATTTLLVVGSSDTLLTEGASELAAATGYEVVTAGSAESARAQVTDHDVDCIVSEYALSDGDGLALYEELRAGNRSLPFVLYVADGDEQVASRAFSAGIDDYVRQDAPDGLTRLAEAVTDAVTSAWMKQTLRESEERYRRLVEQSHDGIYIYQGNEFLFVNDRVCEITGYDEDELLTMEPWEIIHPDDRQRVQTIGARRQRGEDAPNTYEARVLRKDGETRYVEFSVQGITYEGEWAALGSARDVTERRTRQEQLAEERAFIETILDTLEDVIFVFRLDGELIRWNDRLCEFTGYDDAELADLNTFELIPEAYHDLATDQIRTALTTGTGSIEAEVETKSGDRIPFEFRGSPLPDSDGEVIGIAGVARDISDRLAREQELAQYRTIVEAVGDPVYTLDADGRFTLVNDALCSFTGYEEDELVGEHVSKVMREADVAEAERLIQDLLEDETATTATFEVEAVTKSGEHIPGEDQIALLPTADGEFRGTAGVVRDISERKAREQRLRRQNEQLDRFASVVSHDLRNPLSVILGRIEHAAETGDREHFDAIERSAQRMERMIDDLLTLAREGQTVGEVQPVALRQVVESAWETVETGEMTLAVGDDLGRIAADEDRLAALVENLFRNAVDHAGDSVTVSVGRLAEDGFYVADDGPGIPADDREQVFEQGYSTADGGTGLGLVIVRSIARAHGWAVAATESDDGGARFEFTGVEFRED